MTPFLDRVEIVLAQRAVIQHRAVARDSMLGGYGPPAPAMPDLPLAADRATVESAPDYWPLPKPLAELEAEIIRRWR